MKQYWQMQYAAIKDLRDIRFIFRLELMSMDKRFRKKPPQIMLLLSSMLIKFPEKLNEFMMKWTLVMIIS